MKSHRDFNLEEDETFKNAVDLLFDDLARDKPDHFAVRQYFDPEFQPDLREKLLTDAGRYELADLINAIIGEAQINKLYIK